MKFIACSVKVVAYVTRKRNCEGTKLTLTFAAVDNKTPITNEELGAHQMNITRVQVHVLHRPGSLKALADVVFEGPCEEIPGTPCCFKVIGFQVREDKDGCTFVTMPYREREFSIGNGQAETQRINVAHPLNKPTRVYLETKIIDEYERVLNLIASKEPTTP